MSPKVKRYTDIYVILTYTGTDTCVVLVIYTRNPLFRARVKIFFASKRVKSNQNVSLVALPPGFQFCYVKFEAQISTQHDDNA